MNAHPGCLSRVPAAAGLGDVVERRQGSAGERPAATPAIMGA
ncbi:hypothetical protein [Oerskovia paurometabola]|uniref:Uncharacterized protein n=1 Tax=Oerskovia paurometabola TaxID=162170 RepID=A0ABW1XHD9_9CELL|nr:hypothetical protein [Oerskovia paurometabola]MBM7495453.1 hypothetical protein [Oerskovia paurometabola]